MNLKSTAMNSPHKYYKIKAKDFESTREVWIVVKAGSLHDAFHKAEEHCTFTNHIFYPLEQTMHEITREAYIKGMSERNMPKNSE